MIIMSDLEHFEKHPHLKLDNIGESCESCPKVALVGNPNVGKSLFFNHLSGMYVDVSNFPGTTISITKGKYKDYEIYDTPGIYSVSSFSDEEKVARDIILSADIALNVVNSLHLERDLFLTMQLIEMGKKVVVLLNFTDELKKRKIKIDVKRLSEELGVEVIETSAIKKIGFDKLEYAIKSARTGKVPNDLHALLHESLNRVGSQAEALMILEGDEYVSSKHGVKAESAEQREKIYIDRRNRVNAIVSLAETEDSKTGEFFNFLGRLTINPLSGLPILAGVIYIVYLFVGEFVSQRVVNYTENFLGKKQFEYHVKTLVAFYSAADINAALYDHKGKLKSKEEFVFPDGIDLQSPEYARIKKIASDPYSEIDFIFHNSIVRLFFGEFGVLTMTITYLFFLLLPLVLSFYLVMALLEDSGYLPRLAAMLDRAFNLIGLNGRAIIPLVLGFGCVTMANITVRLLNSEKEKTIAMSILQFVIPCSAQLGVIAVLMSGAGLYPFIVYLSTIIIVFFLLTIFLNLILKGGATPLLIDLPHMRFPKLDNVLKKTFFRAYGFMKEAGGWFFVGAFAIGLMEITGALYFFQTLLEPLTVYWLKLPRESANAFIMGMVRRDFGSAGLFDLHLEPMQIAAALITITLFVPCIAAFVVMLKERGWKEGLMIWGATWVTAFLFGGLAAQIFI